MMGIKIPMKQKKLSGMPSSPPTTEVIRDAVASPFVVGYVDIGFGPERLAVFSGINYPF